MDKVRCPARLLPALLLLCTLCPAPARAQGEPQEPAKDTGFALIGVIDGADVFVDGDKVGTTPLGPPGSVSPVAAGEHTIRVVRPGFTPYIDVFKVRQGRITKLPVELVPFSGVLRLRSKVDKARVFVDGQFVGETPLEAEVKIGPHSVRVSHFGYKDDLFSIASVAGEAIEKDVQLGELPPGQNPYRPIAPPPPRWYERWWVWTLAATGVAALAVAVIVPTVYANRDACQRLDAELCISVPSAQSVKMLQVGGRF